jgi:putative inorganic carbon (HCO3(-)) transporter
VAVLTFASLTGPWPRIALMVASLLAAGAIVIRRADLRALATLGALVLAPLLLIIDVWQTGQLHILHRHPLLLGALAVVGLVALVICAFALRRWPQALGPAAAAMLPFRLPIQAGAQTANLLAPLYFVVGAAALAQTLPTLLAAARSDREMVARGYRRRIPFYEYALAGYVVLYAAQSLYSSDFEKALQNLVFFYIPFALLLTLLRTLKWDRRLLVQCVTATVVLAVVFAALGFVEELTKTIFWNPKLIASDQQHRYFEVNSVFYDPNIFGRYLALSMVLVAALLVYARKPRLQAASLVIFAILWVCLLFTLSRSSLAALLVGLAVLGALRWRAAPVIGLAAVLAVAGIVVVIASPNTFGLNQGFNNASSGRANLISGGVRLFRDRPLAGFGSGSFTTEYQRHFANAARAVADSHNIPVTVASEQGVIGLVVYAAVVLGALTTLLRGARGTPVRGDPARGDHALAGAVRGYLASGVHSDPARVAIAAMFFALLLHTMLYADFLEDPTTWMLMAVGSALALQSGAAGKDREDDAQAVAVH